MFAFTTYATLPALTCVGSTPERGDALMLRFGMKREKETLVRLFGMDDGQGLADSGVRRTLTELGRRHRRLNGMRAEYLDLFAGVIAISAIRVRSVLDLPLDAEDYRRYWRYLRHSLALFGASLGEPETVTRSCARFVADNVGAGPRTGGYLAHLLATYPDHMLTAAGALFPQTRRLVTGLLPEMGGISAP
jgi:hypothetical protein